MRGARAAVRADLDKFFGSPLAASELAPRAAKLNTRLKSKEVRAVTDLAAAAAPYVKAGHGRRAAAFLRRYDGPGAAETAEFRERTAGRWEMSAAP